MPNDIVVRSDKNGGKVHLSADRVYDLNEDKTQDVINSGFETSLGSLDSKYLNIIEDIAYHKAGNTANTALTVGTFIYLSGNSTLADGVYQVKSAISAGASYTTNNLTRQSPKGALTTLHDTLVNSTGSGYDKLSDGTMLQWGAATLTASGTMTQINTSGIYQGAFTFTLPNAFFSSNFRIFGSARYSTGYPFTFAGFPTSASQATIYVYDFYARPMNDGKIQIQWFAVGRWKS